MYYVAMINLHKVMTTHQLAKQNKFIRPSENYSKIMDL